MIFITCVCLKLAFQGELIMLLISLILQFEGPNAELEEGWVALKTREAFPSGSPALSDFLFRWLTNK